MQISTRNEKVLKKIRLAPHPTFSRPRKKLTCVIKALKLSPYKISNRHMRLLDLKWPETFKSDIDNIFFSLDIDLYTNVYGGLCSGIYRCLRKAYGLTAGTSSQKSGRGGRQREVKRIKEPVRGVGGPIP